MPPIENHYNDTEEDLQQALANGYVVYSKWTQDKSRHVSAREFNERASTYLPAIKSALDASKRELAKTVEEFEARLARQTSEFEKRTVIQQQIAQDALSRQRKNLVAEYEAKKLSAVAPERREDYLQTLAEQQEAFANLDQAAEAYAPPKQDDVKPKVDPAVQAWLARNTWVNNPMLYATAHALGERYAREKAHMPQIEQLKAITDEVCKRHPDLMREYGFDIPDATPVQEQNEHTDDDGYGSNINNGQRAPSRARHSSVEGVGSSPSGVGSKSKSWKDIPQIDRDVAFSTFIKPGIYGKDEKAAKEAYAKTYWQMYGA